MASAPVSFRACRTDRTARVTFLFTDIEGSTRLLIAVGPERYGEMLGLHQELIRSAIGVHRGHALRPQPGRGRPIR